MSHNEPSIFTKIINREIPADIVYEDEVAIAFFTIEPVNPGHTLVVPKAPSVNILDIEPSVLSHLMHVAQNVARALIETSLGSGVNIHINNCADAGQEVFHTHIHVIPRLPSDEAFKPPRHTTLTTEDRLQIAAKLRNHLDPTT